MAPSHSRSADRPSRSRAGTALTWAIWWVLSVALWLVLAGSPSVGEVATAAGVAVAAATAAILLRDEEEVGGRPRPAALLKLWRPLVAIPRDLARLVVVLVGELRGRPSRGSFFAVPFRAGGDDARARGARSLAPVAGSIAPNTYVVSIDEEADLLVVHQLVPTPHPRDEADPLELA